MNIFVGSFQHPDMFHRVITIIACCSIVVTAVYQLRVIGKIHFGTVENEHHKMLTDATWFERVSAITLIFFVGLVVCLPSFPMDIITKSLDIIIR